MSKFAINPSPLMTSYLVRDLRIFRDDPIVILDVGARGGFNTEWSVFADQIQIYGFEPDEEECRRLAKAKSQHQGQGNSVLTQIARRFGWGRD